MTIVVWFILGLASAQSVISNGTVTTESPIIPVAPSWKNEYLRDVYAELYHQLDARVIRPCLDIVS